MITLPKFDEQSMYDYETYFHLTLQPDRLAKFLVHYEAYKMVQDVPGAIVECGVFKGTSFTRFAMMRELLGNSFSSKLIAFDVFSDEFPNTSYEEDQAQREHWINTAGASSISTDQLSQIFNEKGIKNYELIAGNVLDTVPDYIQKNGGLKISLLNIDIDFVEPTYCVLEHMYDRVMKGGVILLDNYGGEGTSGLSYHGDTRGVDDFFKDKDVTIKQFPFAARPCYIVKE
ncbi:TylF/MycF/NovP-related O-methyltransferase [Paenibacillus sp. FSL H8-0537]|uniref:TylF/MycF/NovP-related O-methyltransferase n=1 Tax=Paenibacillus sp. FSL H8-0537 TaxID=2921399 RepID=UPI003100ABD2